MLGIDAIVQKIEAKMLVAMGDRLSIETIFDPDELTLTTVSTWDGVELSAQSFDLSEMVEEIVRRANEPGAGR